jgi:hypothetical protein
MGMLPFILLAWLIHAVVGGVLALPLVYLARNKVRWRRWESLAFVVPFGVWMLLMLSELSSGRKTLSNLLVEPGVLGLCVALGALLRIAISSGVSERVASGLALAVLCLLAASVFLIVPALPE